MHTYTHKHLLFRVSGEPLIVVQDSLLDFHNFIVSRKENQSGSFQATEENNMSTSETLIEFFNLITSGI